MGYRTTSGHKFRATLGLTQYDAILTKEKSVLIKIMSSLEGENMQAHHKVLSYRIGSYFHKYKLPIEIHESRYSDRIIDYEIKRKKAIEQERGCKFI